MTVKVNHGHRPIGLVDTPQQGQCDGVITTKGNNTRKGLASTRKTGFISIKVRLAHQDAVVSLFDLLDCPGVVVSMSD